MIYVMIMLLTQCEKLKVKQRKEYEKMKRTKLKWVFGKKHLKSILGSRVLKEWSNYPYYQSNRNRKSTYARK